MPTPIRVAWRSEKFRFLVVGAFNTIFGYLVFLAFYYALGSKLHYLIISTISHALSVIVAFTGHRSLVFRSSKPWRSEFIRYNISLLFSFLLGLLSLYVLVEFGGLKPTVGQAITVVFSVMVSYLAHRYYSFKR
jgi:putative flippase GtrA